MKKNILFILSFFCGILYGDVQPSSSSDGAIVEFRPSYFYPISSDFRDIFHDGGINYQLTGTVPIYRGINVWTAVDYFSKEGQSAGQDNKTSIRIIPVTLGLKYFFPSLGRSALVNFYLGGGMKYYFVHTHNHSNYVKRTINENGMGGVVETGLAITIVRHVVLDLFSSYSFKSFGAPAISNSSVEAVGLDVSSINVGVGLGYRF